LCRGVNEFKNRCQPRTNLVNDENDEMPPYSQNALNIWKKSRYLLSANGVRQTEKQSWASWTHTSSSWDWNCTKVEKVHIIRYWSNSGRI